MRPHRASAPTKSPRASLAGVALHVAWVALVVAAPLTAAWVSSSLAAVRGGSTRVAAALGLLVFPVLPVAWEAWSEWRRRRAGATRPRILTRTDRLVLRTLAVSGALLGALLWARPEEVFHALHARGDWMLDGRHDPTSERARRGLFLVAGASSWLWHVRDENPFREGSRARPRPVPPPTRAPVEQVTAPRVDVAPQPPPPPPQPERPRDPRAWPLEDAMHPAARGLTPDEERDPASVGRALAAREPDPWKRTRAVHDWVADRVEYDVDALRSGAYPPQDAETTFRTRRSVCAGYASLFEAIGRAAGLEVETVVGRARGSAVTGMGESHAWNAVRLDGRWHLVDVTWDAGWVDAAGFHKKYSADHLLAPPEVFFARHFPDDARWQLLDAPRTEGDYLRAPALRPLFFAHGLRLVSPDRAESDADAVAEVVLDNPRGASVMARATDPAGRDTPCRVAPGARTVARCPLTTPGVHDVTLFVHGSSQGTHWSAGTLRLVRR